MRMFVLEIASHPSTHTHFQSHTKKTCKRSRCPFTVSYVFFRTILIVEQVRVVFGIPQTKGFFLSKNTSKSANSLPKARPKKKTENKKEKRKKKKEKKEQNRGYEEECSKKKTKKRYFFTPDDQSWYFITDGTLNTKPLVGTTRILPFSQSQGLLQEPKQDKQKTKTQTKNKKRSNS